MVIVLGQDLKSLTLLESSYAGLIIPYNVSIFFCIRKFKKKSFV